MGADDPFASDDDEGEPKEEAHEKEKKPSSKGAAKPASKGKKPAQKPKKKASADDFASDEEDEGAVRLPTHYPPSAPARGSGAPKPTRATHGNDASLGTPNSVRKVQGAGGTGRLGDVWDEREELFGVGDSDGEDEEGARSPRTPAPASAGPQIVITPSSG